MPEPIPPELQSLLAAHTAQEIESAWADFVERFTALLLYIARSLPGDDDRVMDRYAFVLEELRANDLRRIRAFAPGGRARFSTWLAAIARRLCVDHHRRVYGRMQDHGGPDGPSLHPARRALADLIAEEFDPEHHGGVAAPTIEADIDRQQSLTALRGAMEDLDPEERLILALRFEHGMTGREIGELTKLGNTFQMHRRLKSLLRRLEQALRLRGISVPNDPAQRSEASDV